MSKIELHLGDCLEKMKDIPDKSIDMILCDLPYGTTACKWDSVIPFEPMWEQLTRIIKPNGAIVLFGSEPFSSALRMSNIKNYKYDWIFKKTIPSNPLLVKKQILKYHEIISIFYKKQPTFNPQKIQRKEKNKRKNKKASYNQRGVFGNTKMIAGDGEKDWIFEGSVVDIKSRDRGLHPTQKPIELMEKVIKTYTNENETVLDFACGSGTTGVACKNLNRNFIGIELDLTYYDIAKKRINGITTRIKKSVYLDKERIKTEWLEGLSTYKIGINHGCSYATINRALKSIGLDLSSRKYNRKGAIK